MRTALDELGLPPELETPLWNYLTMAADSLRNQPT
jgi:hemoglobin